MPNACSRTRNAMTRNPAIDRADLALHGGRPVVREPFPRPVRWDDRERAQLAEMIGQPSLFYWKGPQTELLLKRFRRHYPLPHAMTCSSGTAAIHIALLAAGIGPGDEVITSPITDMGTVIGILYQQGVPVFADLEPYRYNLDPSDVERKVTDRTRAVLAVHLAGNPCAMQELKALCEARNLLLIEDCAQAWGAACRGVPVGLCGDVACFSLNDFKHIGCGDGGIVATRDSAMGERLQRCGDKGYDRSAGISAPEFLAPNFRMSEPQAAVAAVQLARMPEIARQRRLLGDRLTRELTGIRGIRTHHVDTEDACSYWFYMFRTVDGELDCDRAEFVKALVAEGVRATAGYLPVPLYQFGLFRNENFFAGRWPVKELGLTRVDYGKVSCPAAEAILRTGVKLPVNEAMDEEYISAVGAAVRKVATAFARGEGREKTSRDK